MVTAMALVHTYKNQHHTNTENYNCLDRFLEKNDVEQPCVLQLGGSDPQEMALASKYAASYKYDAINVKKRKPRSLQQFP